VFETNLERSRAFLRIFDKERGPGQPSRDEKELLRGSLVFAVGALDAYLSDLIIEVVPSYGPKSKHLADALRAIARNDPGLALRVALAPTKTEGVDEFRGALREWLATKSFQGPDRLIEALGYVACPISWADFDEATNCATATELEKITSDRHGIVHEGKRPYIRRHLAEEANSLVADIVRCIDAEVCAVYLPAS
jgi:RiboL-PSP-HEPN